MGEKEDREAAEKVVKTKFELPKCQCGAVPSMTVTLLNGSCRFGIECPICKIPMRRYAMKGQALWNWVRVNAPRLLTPQSIVEGD